MLTKIWVNSEREISISIRYEEADRTPILEGNVYLVKIWNLFITGLNGAGFLDDNGNHIFLMRSDNRYDSSVKVYEEFVV